MRVFLVDEHVDQLWRRAGTSILGREKNFDLIVLCCDCEELDWNCGFNVKVICKGTK